MKPFRWSPEKNEALQAERGVSFESVVVAIGSGGLLDILAHPNQAKYPRQRILVVAADDYVYLVPFVEEEGFFFLKTIIPSRKATRDYLRGRDLDARRLTPMKRKSLPPSRKGSSTRSPPKRSLPGSRRPPGRRPSRIGA